MEREEKLSGDSNFQEWCYLVENYQKIVPLCTKKWCKMELINKNYHFLVKIFQNSLHEMKDYIPLHQLS